MYITWGIYLTRGAGFICDPAHGFIRSTNLRILAKQRKVPIMGRRKGGGGGGGEDMGGIAPFLK